MCIRDSYDTPWGIAVWIAIGIAIIALFILIYKKGDKIEEWFLNLFRKKKGKKTSSENFNSTQKQETKRDHDS